MKNELLVVIPAYNEERNLLKVIEKIREFTSDAEIAVVDDGSVDKTASSLDSDTVLIRHAINLGDGAARQTGFKYALQKGFEFVINIDADGQHNPGDIVRILRELREKKYDIIIGSRFISGKRSNNSLLRYIGSRIFSYVVRLLTGELITDPTSGFRGVNRKAMYFFANHFYPESYPDADVIIASHYSGLKIKEIPVSMNMRKAGKSLHVGLSPVYYMYKMCLSIFTALFYRYGGKDAN